MDVRSTDPPPPASVPRRVGRYRLREELGRGGMGVVYRAEDPRLGRDVALKVLPDALARDPAAKARLLAEARAAATLDHPNVCTVHEVAETADGRPYIVLACYDGASLDARLAEGPLAVAEAVRVGREAAAGVAAAHAAGIVHRDLKPANVFLCADGRTKVLDFGIAAGLGSAGAAEGPASGTLAYAAPEQAHGRADARSDVWGLGVTLYEALTGARPFAAPYEAAVAYAVAHETPPPPSARRADVPAALDAVVMRCLAKDPADRYPDAAALEAALADVLGTPRVPVLRRRHRLVAAAVGAGLLLAAGLWALREAGVLGGGPVHLAVLAFEPPSDAPDDRAFAEGLAESLASGVVEVAPPDADVWVVPTFQVRDLRVTSAGAARAALGADLVLMGRVEAEGEGLRVTLDLVEAADRPRVRASRTFAVAADDAGTVRGRALRAVVEMLGFDPDAPGSEAYLAAGTDDPEAERFFIAGLGFLRHNREAGDLDRAVDLFERAIAEDPTFVEAWARLGQAALAQYEATRDSVWVGRTRTAAERARALDARNVDVQVTLSKLADATGEFQLAVHHAREALALDSTSTDALLALAAAQEATADVAGAEATRRRALARHPDDWTIAYDLGWFYLRQLELERAVVQFEAVVRLVPDNYKGHHGLGAAHQTAGDVGAARAAYERVLELRPDYYGVYSNLGTLLLYAEDAEGAAEVYRRALALDSTDHRAWRNLASAYWETGDRDAWTDAMRGALRRAEAALAVNPNDAAMRVSAATYREGLGDAAGARADARRAAALAPADPTVLSDVAYVFAQLGDRADALSALRAAVEAGFDLDGVTPGSPLAPAAAALRRSSPP